MHQRIRPLAIIALILVASTLLARSASAAIIAADSYTIGSNPAQGQYAVNYLRLEPSNLANTGFVNGAYTGGSGTSQFSAQNATTFGYAPFGANGANAGEVNYAAASLDGATRTNARNFSAAAVSTAASSPTLWFNILVSSDGTSTLTGNNGSGTTVTVNNGSVLATFGNNVPPLQGATAGNYSGLGFGFASHSATDTNDLVIRYRSGASTDSDVTLVSNTSGVYDIVARLDVNYNGGSADYLTYWVNPTDFSSQAALDSSSLLTNDTGGLPNTELSTFASQGTSSDFTRLGYTSTNWNGNDNFGDAAMGQSLSDLSTLLVPAMTSVPEPGSLIMAGIGMMGVLGLAFRRRARV